MLQDLVTTRGFFRGSMVCKRDRRNKCLAQRLHEDQRSPRIRSLVASLALALASANASAKTVTNCLDNGPGSLRDAYISAADGDTIDLSQLACSAITLTTGALLDSGGTINVTLQGAGQLIQSSTNDRVLMHNSTGTLTINNLRIAHGNYTGNSGGGCIYSKGAIFLHHSTVSSCHLTSAIGGGDANGGAIYACSPSGVYVYDESVIKDSTTDSPNGVAQGGGLWAVSIRLKNSTISGNASHATAVNPSKGGGIYATFAAVGSYSTISNNTASLGGGIFTRFVDGAEVGLSNSTVSGNTAVIGGGVYAVAANIATSTIANNEATNTGGVFLKSPRTAGQVWINVIASHNNNGDVGGDSSSTISGTHNLIVDSALPIPVDTIRLDAMLGPLQNNGGPTLTHALLEGSPAIDHGVPRTPDGFDQRGIGHPRKLGPAQDIGAFEFADAIFVNGFDPVP